MRRQNTMLACLMATWLIAGPTFGQDYATGTGSWQSTSTWTTGTVPTSSSDVYIGSTSGAGAALTATVTLNGTASASNVYLGNGSGSSGTLDLNGNTLTIGNNLVLGQNSSTGSLSEVGGGSFTAANLYVENGNTLSLGASDVVSTVQLSGTGTALTTAASGNITSGGNVGTGSTLNLGANTTLTNSLNVQDSGSTLNMNGHSLTVDNQLLLGWNGSSAVTLANRGTLDVATLYVGNGQTFNINAGDTVGTFNLSGGSTTLNANVDTLNLSSSAVGTTTTSGSITSSANVESGSTLNLGANTTLTNSLNVQDSGSTLNMNGHSLTVDNQLLLGWNGSSAVTLANRGTLDVATLYVGNGQTFNINAGDTVGTFNLSGGSTTLNANVDTLNLSSSAVGTTTTSGSITSSASVESGSTLNLGANTTLTNSLNVQDSGSTLNMNGHSLTVDNQLLLGWNGSSAVTLANRGTLDVATLYVGNGQTFNINAGDTVGNFSLSGGSTTLGANVGSLNLSSSAVGTTTTLGSITSSANVETGSTLNLGANTTLTGNLNVQDSGSTLNMNGHSLTMDNQLLLGWNGSSAVTLANRGTLDVATLYVGNGQTFNINAGDTVGTFNLSGGSTTLNANVDTLNLSSSAVGTTTTSGSITSSANVETGSTLNLGANTTLTGNLNVQDSGSTLNMNGHSLTMDNQLLLGWNGSSAVTLANRGTLDVATLYVGNGQTFNINAGDTVGTFNLSGGSTTLNANVDTLNLSSSAVGTTTTSGSITSSASVESGSTLNLGANTTLTGNLNVQDSGSTLNMNGHSLTMDNQLLLGWNGSSAVTLANRGTLDVATLNVGNGQTFNINAGDTVGTFNLSSGSTTLNANVDTLNLSNSAVAATTTSGTITSGGTVETGSTLNLGANTTLTGNLNVQDSGSTLNMNGHSLTMDNQLLLGWNGSSAVTVNDAGKIDVSNLYMGNGTALTMHGGDVVSSLIDLKDSSVLTVDQVGGTGLTLNGTSSGSLVIDPSSMDLVFTSTAAGNWDFAWKDPSGGNWISTLTTMIDDGEIKLTLLPGQSYSIVNMGGYTYIEGVGGTSVPEPSSLVLACLAGGGLVIATAWRRRRSR